MNEQVARDVYGLITIIFAIIVGGLLLLMVRLAMSHFKSRREHERRREVERLAKTYHSE